MNLQTGLYLIPVNISDAPYASVLPLENIDIIKGIRYFIVENVRTARRFIKKCDPSADISSFTFYELNRHTDDREIFKFLQPLRDGNVMGVMSEAGCPGVADPGASVVRIAQAENLKVIPLVGPSSILMALMASGLNGQNFAFHGYLPVENTERERKIRELDNQSEKYNITQIFIETPYRNDKMLDSLLKVLKADTLLCIAQSVTDPEKEKILTKPTSEWRKLRLNIEKEPTVFLFYSPNQIRRTNQNYGKKKNFI